MMQLVLVDVDEIRPHEEVDMSNVQKILRSMLRGGLWTKPVLIEQNSFVLLDGHHRLRAARLLDLAQVPVRLVEYADIELSPRRHEIPVTKAEVVHRALARQLYPAKTTCHTHNFGDDACEVDLRILRRAAPEIRRLTTIWQGGPAPRKPGDQSRYAPRAMAS